MKFNAICGGRPVPPSGDISGVTDSANIATAVAAQQYASVAYGGTGTVGAVILDGTYYVNSPIELGAIASLTKFAVSLIGANAAAIHYVGNQTDNYVVRCIGDPVHNVATQIKNLYLDCHDNARGVLVTNQTYFGDIQNITIHQSSGVGLDLIRCWAADVKNILVQDFEGYGMRMKQFNSSRLSNVRLRSGVAANFPSGTELYAVEESGITWLPDSSLESFMLATGNCMKFENIIFEGNSNAKPCLYLTTINHAIDTLRFEGNASGSNPRVVIDGGTDGDTVQGVGIAMSNVYQTESSYKVPHLIKCIGKTGLNKITDSNLLGCTTNVMYMASGEHYGTIVDRVSTFSNEIAAANHIGVDAGATYDAAVQDKIIINSHTYTV